MAEGEDTTSAAAIFASMVPPASIAGQIEAKILMETSALDAFIVQLLDALRKLASVSAIFFVIWSDLTDSIHVKQSALAEKS